MTYIGWHGRAQLGLGRNRNAGLRRLDRASHWPRVALGAHGDVDLADFAQLLADYGTTSGVEYENGDLDGDGDLDLSDLAALLGVYGTTCE